MFIKKIIGGLNKFQSQQKVSSLFKSGQDCANKSSLNTIRLNHNVSSLVAHLLNFNYKSLFEIITYIIQQDYHLKQLTNLQQMGRKRRDMGCLRPFCFYCEKSFKNEVILHHHQKAKHFCCTKCGKKFSSIDSLISHAKTHHTQQIERVPNANVGRDNVALKIFGMQGVPRIQIETWINRSVNRYWGKIMEKKMTAEKKKMKEMKKDQGNEQKIEQQNNNNIEEEQNGQFPLEFKINI